MAEPGRLEKVIETDVLIIGAGIAGLFAAVRARDFVEHVTLVDKGPIGNTSQAYYALGGHQTFLPGDDIDEWLKDVVYFQDGLCEQDLIESIYKETFDRISDLERLGVEFIKHPDGEYRRFPTRGIEHVRGLRPHPHGAGGKNEIQALFREAKRLGVKLLSRICVTDILKYNGTAVGAVGFHIRGGGFYIFKTGAVVIATGQCSFKGHYEDMGFVTGDGMAMALRAGAKLVGLEFPMFHGMPARYAWEGLGTAFPMGARVLNARGETFMDIYSPILKNRIDYTYLARAMAIETKNGRGPFYLDYSPIKPDDLSFLRKPHGWMELHLKKLAEAGVNPFDGKQLFMPGINSFFGIKADIDCKTEVPGL
ncbi:FAD-dependent oxidoreductase, partial [Chloroflexota bacterium]